MGNEFHVQTGLFQGPLDLLLSLIQDRKLYINELSLAEVTDGYLSYVQSHESLPMGETAQFILVAATLLLIKSRSLLPGLELSKEEEGSIDELTKRLEHYQSIRHAAKIIQRAWGGLLLHFAARPPLPPTIVFRPGEATTETVRAAARILVRALPSQDFRPEARVEAVRTLEEVIEHVKTRVLSAVKTSFKDLASGASRTEVILHFLALLELVKGGSLAAEQESHFGDIMLETHDVGTPRYGAA
jgi:segregation and condensation protein A